MNEVISFYSAAPTQGKRTLSLAFAQLIAEHDHKTLYVELDTAHPSVTVSTQIGHPIKNALEYFQATVTRNNFSLESHVLDKNTLMNTDNRDLRRVFSELPSNLDYLVFPEKFHENSFPDLITEGENSEIQANEYIQKFMYELKASRYEYVILNLPNELNSIFGFPVIAESDQVVTITTASASRLMEYKQANAFMSNNIPEFESKFYTIVNMTSPHVQEEELLDLVHSDAIVIPFDVERQQAEFALETGSELIKERLEKLAFKMQISVIQSNDKKSFSLFRKG